jgi:hypothetical protein
MIKTLTGKNLKIEAIPGSKLRPDGAILAMAHFCAAVHNAHGGQPAGILRYHCSKAVEYSPKISGAMIQFADFSTRRTSTVLCRSFMELLLRGNIRQYEGAKGFLHQRDRKLMDIPLVDAMGEALEKVDGGVRQRFDRVRVQEHAIRSKSVNLLESYYSQTHYNDHFDAGKTGVYRARNIDSIFYFISDGSDREMKFTICCRCPCSYPAAGELTIRSSEGGPVIERLVVSNTWQTQDFVIRGQDLKRGVNRLIITWPFFYQSFGANEPTSPRALLRKVFPIIGEISILSCKTWQASEKPDT